MCSTEVNASSLDEKKVDVMATVSDDEDNRVRSVVLLVLNPDSHRPYSSLV